MPPDFDLEEKIVQYQETAFPERWRQTFGSHQDYGQSPVKRCKHYGVPLSLGAPKAALWKLLPTLDERSRAPRFNTHWQ